MSLFYTHPIKQSTYLCEQMNKFKAIQPSAPLAPYVKQYWFVTIEDVTLTSQRLVPFGCTALSFHKGDRTYSSLENDYLPQSHLHGITTNYTNLSFSGFIDFICIIFQPAGAKAFLKMPLNEFNATPIPLDILGDSELSELARQLNETANDSACTQLIEHFLYQRISQLNKYNNIRMNAAIDMIYKGPTNVNHLAETVCLSYKQFKRIFLESIGLNPKDFSQIIRFQKVHHLLQLHTDMTLDKLADECGYYDKSHLIKEMKEFSGFTPAELLEACDPTYSAYHGLFRSAFINLPLE